MRRRDFLKTIAASTALITVGGTQLMAAPTELEKLLACPIMWLALGRDDNGHYSIGRGVNCGKVMATVIDRWPGRLVSAYMNHKRKCGHTPVIYNVKNFNVSQQDISCFRNDPPYETIYFCAVPLVLKGKNDAAS